MAKFCPFPMAALLACMLAAHGAAARRSRPGSTLEPTTEIISDPFASAFGPIAITPALGSPCGLKGIKQRYFVAGIVVGATLEVGQTTTTLDVVSQDLKQMWTAGGFDENLIGTPMKTEEFRQAMCTPKMKVHFRDACDYFAPSNLVLVCPVLAAGVGWGGLQSIGGTISNAIPGSIRDPFESGLKLFGSGAITAAQGSPCGLKGYKQSYFMMGVIKAATLEIGQTTTTFDVTSDDLVKMLTTAGFDEDLIGKPVKTEVFQQAMCSPNLHLHFPDACAFFARTNLVLVCPVLAAGVGAGQLWGGLQSIGSTFRNAASSMTGPRDDGGNDGA